MADGGDGFEVGVGGRVGGFYLFEERCFAGVVEAEEEDGVFWWGVRCCDGAVKGEGEGESEDRSGYEYLPCLWRAGRLT